MLQEELDDCNHWLYMDDPERFNKVVVRFAHGTYIKPMNFEH